MTSELTPFLKWAGGKRQLLPEIRNHLPSEFNTYFEPFVGAGAVLFDLKPKKAVINDANKELINTYLTIRDNIDELIQLLSIHKKNHSEDYFYKIRNVDRNQKIFNKMSNTEKAARIIYLNKTSFNGLFRENSKGEYNSPFGKYINPSIFDEAVLRSIHAYLNQNDVKILNGDFKEAVKTAKKGDLIYFDPPYDPLSSTSSFTSYSKGGFSKEDQKRLRDLFEELHKKGCLLILSNSSTDFIMELYKDFSIELIDANRNINSKGDKRGKVKEVLVLSFK